MLDQKQRSEKTSTRIGETEDLIKTIIRTEPTLNLSPCFAVYKRDIGLGICAYQRCQSYKG